MSSKSTQPIPNHDARKRVNDALDSVLPPRLRERNGYTDLYTRDDGSIAGLVKVNASATPLDQDAIEAVQDAIESWQYEIMFRWGVYELKLSNTN